MTKNSKEEGRKEGKKKMTIYDDIIPIRPQHMNEDPHSPWKQCERCSRIFNMLTEGRCETAFRYGDGLEGKPINPNGPTFTKTYCLECVKEGGERAY